MDHEFDSHWKLMFIKYDKTYHLFPVTSKHNLEKVTVSRLLADNVVVEEKMDGANTGIIRHSKGFSLQKRNSLVGPSVHEQFDFFHNWANLQNYEKIMEVPEGYLIYGELMYAVHHIYYDKLPDFFLVFDIRKGKRWLNHVERDEFCEKYGFHQVPRIGYGAVTSRDLDEIRPTESAYGSRAEGIVIKQYAKHGYFRAKIVDPLFIEQIGDTKHWMNKQVRKNALDDCL